MSQVQSMGYNVQRLPPVLVPLHLQRIVVESYCDPFFGASVWLQRNVADNLRVACKPDLGLKAQALFGTVRCWITYLLLLLLILVP